MNYYTAKSLGLCPWCGKLPTTPHVYCDSCLEIMTPNRTIHLQLKRQEIKVEEIKGPVVACCGKWHEIRSIPMTTTCGHVYFERS